VAETKTPLDAPAPPGAALNAGGQVPAGANANTTSDSADMKAIYQSTLVYYKRNNPVLTRRRFVSLSNMVGCLILYRAPLKGPSSLVSQERATDALNPSQIILPDGQVSHHRLKPRPCSTVYLTLLTLKRCVVFVWFVVVMPGLSTGKASQTWW